MRRTRLKPKSDKRRMMQELDLLVRERVLVRDRHRCVKCGKSERLQAAHILPKGRYPRLRFEAKNILTLCVGCHLYWAHKDPITFVAWLGDKYPGLLEQLQEWAATAAKVDMKLLLTVLRAEAAHA